MLVERPRPRFIAPLERQNVTSSPPLVDMKDEDVSNKPVFFNCSIYFVDSRTDSQPVASLDVYDNGTIPETQPDPTLGVRMIGPRVHDGLRRSLALSEIGVLGQTIDTVAAEGNETFRDFFASDEFHYGISRKNQSASELWLSAYIGNYIGNCLSLLNDLLERVEIEEEGQVVNTLLFVKWRRVAATFGSLAIFQVFFGLAALVYCRGSCEVVDDVLTLSSMFTSFPFNSQEAKQRGGVVYQGRFAAEGDSFRWELAAEAAVV